MFDDHEDEAAALASYLAATPAGDRRRALAELDEALATTASEQERSDLLDQLGFCYLVEPDYAGIDAFIAWLRAELAASLGDDG
jgi:hypothetical protein